MKPFSTNIQRPLGVCIHILVWALIFFFPVLMSGDKNVMEINWSDYLRHIKMPALLLVVFYINYLWLVPSYLLARRNRQFVFGNLLLLLCVIGLAQWQKPVHPTGDDAPKEEVWREPTPEERATEERAPGMKDDMPRAKALESQEMQVEQVSEREKGKTEQVFQREEGQAEQVSEREKELVEQSFQREKGETKETPEEGYVGAVQGKQRLQPQPPFLPHFERDFHPPRWTFILRDIIIFLCTIGLSAAIRMSSEWRKAQAALRESELKNLRNQMNPHFLLNTLNNIYALIAFDADKAQQAVQDLSKLLRHLLYENQQTYVPLSKEIDFIHNYVELMRIRLPKQVEVTIRKDVPADTTVEIAPLIFISLIENAFKHGISPTEESFIHVNLSLHGTDLLCEISNSNHPKKDTDKSGSGIGLEQVQKRLDLIYPGRYQWTKEVSANGKVYTSRLRIHI